MEVSSYVETHSLWVNFWLSTVPVPELLVCNIYARLFCGFKNRYIVVHNLGWIRIFLPHLPVGPPPGAGGRALRCTP